MEVNSFYPVSMILKVTGFFTDEYMIDQAANHASLSDCKGCQSIMTAIFKLFFLVYIILCLCNLLNASRYDCDILSIMVYLICDGQSNVTAILINVMMLNGDLALQPVPLNMPVDYDCDIPS